MVHDPEEGEQWTPCCSQWHDSWQKAQYCGEHTRRLLYLGVVSITIAEKR